MWYFCSELYRIEPFLDWAESISMLLCNNIFGSSGGNETLTKTNKYRMLNCVIFQRVGSRVESALEGVLAVPRFIHWSQFSWRTAKTGRLFAEKI